MKAFTILERFTRARLTSTRAKLLSTVSQSDTEIDKQLALAPHDICATFVKYVFNVWIAILKLRVSLILTFFQMIMHSIESLERNQTEADAVPSFAGHGCSKSAQR
jgi:hypothetical protein